MVEHAFVHHDVVMENNAHHVTSNYPFVRDPNGALGGVLAGLARTQGWDVSLVRLAFVACLLITFGTALVTYLVAWMIIPVANELDANPAFVDAPPVNPSM